MGALRRFEGRVLGDLLSDLRGVDLDSMWHLALRPAVLPRLRRCTLCSICLIEVPAKFRQSLGSVAQPAWHAVSAPCYFNAASLLELCSSPSRWLLAWPI